MIIPSIRSSSAVLYLSGVSGALELPSGEKARGGGVHPWQVGSSSKGLTYGNRRVHMQHALKSPCPRGGSANPCTTFPLFVTDIRYLTFQRSTEKLRAHFEYDLGKTLAKNFLDLKNDHNAECIKKKGKKSVFWVNCQRRLSQPAEKHILWESERAYECVSKGLWKGLLRWYMFAAHLTVIAFGKLG